MSEAAPSPRSEPLLWLQLLGLGFLPLEALLLLLLLGASDPGPLPLLERLLCWAIGGLAPAVLLWRLPADPWSLLVAQVPLRGRRPIQQRLSALQPPLLLRLGTLGGVGILSLLMLWWCDDHAAAASAFSPVAESPRLVGLLLAAALLALVQWQGQQVVQALWLLSRSAQDVAAVDPKSAAALERARRLSFGLPLLLLPPLQASIAPASVVPPASTASSSPAVVVPLSGEASAPEAPLRSDGAGGSPTAGTTPGAEAQQSKPEHLAEAKASDQPVPSTLDPAAPGLDSLPETDLNTAAVPVPSGPHPDGVSDGDTDPSALAAAIAVEPEQPTEDQQGSALDQEIR